MDPIKNPFSPGAGSPPPELVGRDPILAEARILLARVKQKRSEKSMLLTGLRGVGKTVLLNIGLDIEPEKGAADSGDLEIDLPNLFAAVGEAAEDRKSAVAIFIDEVQYFNQKELGALIMSMHKIQQRQLPLVLLGAGLPILPGLAGESKSYAERLFSFPDIGPLSAPDAAKALRDPAKAAGVTFEATALDEVFRLTKGYPYFVQEWGYQSWNLATSSPITKQIVKKATATVIPRLDMNFFRVRYDRLTPGEKNFLRAMAELGDGPPAHRRHRGCVEGQGHQPRTCACQVDQERDDLQPGTRRHGFHGAAVWRVHDPGDSHIQSLSELDTTGTRSCERSPRRAAKDRGPLPDMFRARNL